ncbi:helix-turn-helix domain-containing protein [Tateyamaria sp.]|uniref:helix-turn-helix domain-containing protein n=1 Tax=Tateyamaria sp. TaxID=1929288 RepID=UPI0039B99BD6
MLTACWHSEENKTIRSYKLLNQEERRRIETWHAAKVSVDVITKRLKRKRSTIFRKLRRNHFTDAEMLKVVESFGVNTSMVALS